MKTLAYFSIALSLPALATAQSQSPTQSQSLGDEEPVMYTLTIDEEMIKALRDGQSLMSTIPASIRGKVDRIRIEFKPTAASPTSQPALQNGNSILNRGTSSDVNRQDGPPFGQSTTPKSNQPPPLVAPNLTTDLNRSSAGSQSGSAQPGSNFDWNPSRAPVQRSTSTLTPIDNARDGWFIGGRRDSNSIFTGSSERDGIQTSPPSNVAQPIGRQSFDSPPLSDDRIFTGPPPALSRSLPAMDSGLGSSGIMTSRPTANPLAADNTPTVGADQILSKPPAESSGRQLLGANDSSTSRSDDRTQVYLFMLLLCSLGLNVYLAWISRGFYVRYQELASELRDTFTPSNAA